jgi:hypothetical protein
MKGNDRVRVMDMMFTTLKDVQSIFSCGAGYALSI